MMRRIRRIFLMWQTGGLLDMLGEHLIAGYLVVFIQKAMVRQIGYRCAYN